MDGLETGARSPMRVSCMPAGVLAVAGKMLFKQLAFTPAEIIAAAAPDIKGRVSGYGGVYFLIWKGRIVYIGKATTLRERLNAHIREGRPHDGVTVIAGLPGHIASALEDCYVRAWSPPWNSMTTSGYHVHAQLLRSKLEDMDRTLIMPWFAPRGGREIVRMKCWEQHVLGYRQARPST